MTNYILKEDNVDLKITYLDKEEETTIHNYKKFSIKAINSALRKIKIGIKLNKKEVASCRRGSLETLEIVVSSRCNLCCKHCCQGTEIKTEKKIRELDIKRINQCIDDGITLGAIKLFFTGGEFLVYPHYEKALAYAKKRRLRIGVGTNGILINEEIVDKFKKYGVYVVVMSIDGLEKEHDFIRGKGTFAKTIRAIRLLRNAKIKVLINVTVHNLNVHYLHKLDTFLRYKKVDAVRFAPLQLYGNANKYKDILQIQEKNQIEKMKGFFNAIKDEKARPMKRCKAFVRMISINYDGKVYPCHIFRAYEMCSLGNIFNKRLKNIYKEAELIQPEIVNMDFKNLKECKTCPKLSVCKAGCRARALRIENDLYGKDPFMCFLYRNMEVSCPNELV